MTMPLRTLIATLGVTLALCGQQGPAVQEEGAGTPVLLDDQLVLVVRAPFEGAPAPERARLISERLLSVARNRTIPVSSIRVADVGKASVLIARTAVILAIGEDDAAAARVPRAQLAADTLKRVQAAVQQYRDRRRVQALILAGVKALAVTMVFAALIWLIRRLYRSLRHRVSRGVESGRYRVQIQKAVIVPSDLGGSVLMTALTVGHWLAIFILLDIYIPLVLGFFPGTARTSQTILGWIYVPLGLVAGAIRDNVDEVFFVVIIGIISHYVIKVSNFFFRAIRDGKIRIEGFYADWADPTAKLVRVLILLLALVAAYPYIPGSRSPAFQGISLFLGLLLSIGGSATVANLIAGIVLTYMRAFQVGDYVRIADHVGDVVEKTLLATRIRTIRNVVVTISNVSVLGANIVNYSGVVREKGLALNTSVTIGYDAPWRTVHELLIAAARSTRHILHDPPPFVLQTALNDFYVTYEINAYTDQANRMDFIYGELHQNIQDKFNEAGVEIMSPHYAQLRDGNTVTIPAPYRPSDYRPGALRVTNSDAATGRDARRMES